jgi:hypothetical protein
MPVAFVKPKRRDVDQTNDVRRVGVCGNPCNNTIVRDPSPAVT